VRIGTQHEADLAPPQGRFAVVVSRFNAPITERLLQGALEALRKHRVADDAVDVVWVPGSFEIPLVASRLAQSRRYAAVIGLGCVIQGETDHHEYINQQVSAGLARVALDTGVPVTFGILTCHTVEQAQERAGGKVGSKGAEAALAAIEMANLLNRLEEGQA
jgi:6,7-dimethyl-8-ribityllumazine synthase